MKEKDIERVINDIYGLGREIGISQDRISELINDFFNLTVSNPVNIVVYNTITTNRYNEKERRILFYMWGRLSD